jgi:hypothetical protein
VPRTRRLSDLAALWIGYGVLALLAIFCAWIVGIGVGSWLRHLHYRFWKRNR